MQLEIKNSFVFKDEHRKNLYTGEALIKINGDEYLLNVKETFTETIDNVNELSIKIKEDLNLNHQNDYYMLQMLNKTKDMLLLMITIVKGKPP